MTPQRTPNGYVLVNALLLVAALAAASVYLLSRSEGPRAQALAVQQTTQLTAYLGAFDALAKTLLFQDQSSGSVDHLGESWATTGQAVALDRGTISGDIIDLHGRFNLNWLADVGDVEAAAAFANLTAQVGLGPAKAQSIVTFLSPGGPDNRSPWAGADPPQDPVGGALAHAAQIEAIPGLTSRDLDLLRPHITAIPGDMRLNINTVNAIVLRSFLPDARPAQVDTLLRERNTRPFNSPEDIEPRMIAVLGNDAVEGLTLDRFGVTSTWFLVQSQARLDGRQAERQSIMLRPAPSLAPQKIFGVDDWE